MQITNRVIIYGVRKSLGRIRGLANGFFYLAAILLVATTTVLGQGTTSTLGGEVHDPQGRLVVGAVVTVTSDETGVHWTAKTNSASSWRVDALLAGHYHFTVEAAGFEVLQHSSVELQIADQKFVDVTMSIGNLSQVITVSAETPLIDTTAAVSGITLSNNEIDQLPSESNSPLDFLRMTPGVVLLPPTGGALMLWSNSGLSGAVTNGAGSGTNAMNYLVDGGSDTIASSGQIAFVPPDDAVKETKMMTNGYDASIERTAAGTANMMIKSGGQSFHGSIYEHYQDTSMNSNTYQNNLISKPRSVDHANEWGGTFGGPLWIPKLWDGRKRGTFFFFSYDGIHNYSPVTVGTYLSLPSALERIGDFSQTYMTNNGTVYPYQIYDPATATPAGVRTQFTGNMIPSNRISTIAKDLLAYVPLPNKAADSAGSDSNNYLVNEPKVDLFSSWIGRLDQDWNNNHHSYFEFRHNDLSELAGDLFGPGNILSGAYLARSNDDATLNHAWVLSPKLLVTMLANMTAWKTKSYSPADKNTSAGSFGFSSAFVNQQLVAGLPAINGLFTTLGNTSGPSYENDYNYEGRVMFQQLYGNHTLKYGLSYLVQQEATGSQGGEPGSYTFSNIWTTANPNVSAGTGVGNTFASFLLGLPASGSITNAASAYYSQPYIGTFIQDDWRVTQHLTLDLGLRWDYQFPLTERDNRYWSRFDPNYNLSTITSYAQPNYASEVGGASTNTGIQLLQAQRSDPSSFVARGAILYAGTNGESRSITNAQPNYFQPRVGVSYMIRPNLVVNAGLGRFVESNYVASHANQAGYSATTTFNATTNNYITPSATLDNPYPNGLVADTGNSLGVYTSPGTVTSFYTPDIKRQYTDDFSTHLQYQWRNYVLQVGGVYEHTYGIVVGQHINNAAPAQYHAAYDPQFTSSGAPVTTEPGNTQVTNPFKGSPYITNSLETSSTVTAYTLLRPNPLLGDLVENFYNGKSDHYALQSTVQRRMRNGAAITGSFSWGKQMDTTGFVTNSVFNQTLLRQLSSSDRRFQLTVAGTYTLPFGRGQIFAKNANHYVDAAMGGWSISPNYIFYSGNPLSLPTNSSFFQSGDPGLGGAKTLQHWFNTAKFAAFPASNTPASQVQNSSIYPAWTGISALPGYGYTPAANNTNGVYNDFTTWSTNNPTQYGDIRNPYINTWNVAIAKNFHVEKCNVQLRGQAFNALNHPTFGSINTTPGNTYFGYNNGSSTLSQTNDPRILHLVARISF